MAASIDMGEALGRLKRHDAARQELQRAISTSERLALRALHANALHALGNVSATEGRTAEAARRRAEAIRIVEEMQKEVASHPVAKRVDFSQILALSKVN